jgi:hypothetical protein
MCRERGYLAVFLLVQFVEGDGQQHIFCTLCHTCGMLGMIFQQICNLRIQSDL